MLRSLSSGVSGLRNFQVRMDVIGNNVANVNTVAFKAGRVEFKEGFAQLMASASRPSGEQGGIDAEQIGLGSQVGSVATLFTQGNLENTGINTDLAVQGNSFFVMGKGSERYYTRAGNFTLDANGKLVSAVNGFAVQGRTAVGGKLSDTIGDVQIPIGQKAPASATTKVTASGNLDASAPVFDKGSAASLDALDPVQRALPQNAGAFKDMSITVYDSLGTKHELKMVMWKTDKNKWDWKFDSSGTDIAANSFSEVAGTHPITFTDTGAIDTSAAGFAMPKIKFTPTDGAADLTISLDLGSGLSGLSQFAGSSDAVMRDQDGFSVGTLQDFTIDKTGTLVGSYSNGTTQVLGQVALADFNNPEGLERVGDNMYTTSGNSGEAVLNYVGEGSTSSIAAGALEMSNVDLAQEFTNMIVAQRGFQANGRVITTSDQMLEELVSLKR